MGGWVPWDRRSHRGDACATNAFAIMGKMQFRDDDEFDQGVHVSDWHARSSSWKISAIGMFSMGVKKGAGWVADMCTRAMERCQVAISRVSELIQSPVPARHK